VAQYSCAYALHRAAPHCSKLQHIKATLLMSRGATFGCVCIVSRRWPPVSLTSPNTLLDLMSYLRPYLCFYALRKRGITLTSYGLDSSLSPFLSMLHALQRTTAHCNTLQHTATHCNTMQRTLVPPACYHLDDSLPLPLYATPLKYTLKFRYTL